MCEKGTSEIQIIILDSPKSEGVVQWDGKAFMKMKDLRTLIIRNERFSEGPKILPNSLRVLEWWEYPLQSLPSDFYPEKLAILKLPCADLSPKLSKFEASITRIFHRSYINRFFFEDYLLYYLSFLFKFFPEVPEHETFES